MQYTGADRQVRTLFVERHRSICLKTRSPERGKSNRGRRANRWNSEPIVGVASDVPLPVTTNSKKQQRPDRSGRWGTLSSFGAILTVVVASNKRPAECVRSDGKAQLCRGGGVCTKAPYSEYSEWAEQLLEHACARQGKGPGSLSVHRKRRRLS